MLEKLSDRIYYMPNDSRTDRPALGLVCGDKYSLAVDCGNSPAHAHEFMKNVSQLDVPPVKYAAITHWHWDHVFGIDAANLITICHYKTKEKLDIMRNWEWDDFSLDERVKKGEEITFCSEHIKLEMPSREDLKIGKPDIIFKDNIEIDLGGITCIIQNVSGCHSEDSCIIYIPQEKTMFLGDCLCEDFYTGEWSYNLKKFASMANKIKKYETETFIISHDTPKTKEDIWGFMDKVINVGELVDDDISEDKVTGKYIKMNRKAPDEEEAYFIKTFVNDNIKNNMY